jgi:broad specificity phosphatase PhoE
MKPLILVKHSLPQVVETIPAREWTLSEPGRERAEKLAERLRVYEPDFIVSSAESKAQETASILAGILGLQFQVGEGLHEHDRSTSPYYSKDVFQSLIQKSFAQPDSPLFGSETANQALARFRSAVQAILDVHKDDTVLLVSHGTVISLFVSWLTGCDGYALWHELALPSFVVLDLSSRTVLKTENLP